MCFPDKAELAATPFVFDHAGSDEFCFTLTPTNSPRIYGFVRRYRVGFPAAGGRLDMPPHTSSDAAVVAATPVYQCICILSERCVARIGPCCG